MRAHAAALALVCGVVLGAAPTRAADAPMRDVGSFSGFDHIKTSGGIDYNLSTGIFSIPQRFDATRAGTEISADKADGNSKQRLLHASGDVVVHQNQPLTGRGRQASQYSQKPSTLTADKLDVDGMRKLYVATGNVHFTQLGGREATADAATLDDASNQLHLQGHVHIKDGEESLDGDVVDYNTVTGQVHAAGVPLITTVPLATPEPIVAPPRKAKSRRT